MHISQLHARRNKWTITKVRHTQRRCGYAMLLVMIFISLLLSVASVCFRDIASALRTEQAMEQLEWRDEGVVRAVAEATTLLESGLPPASPFVGGIAVDTSAGTRSFTVTFIETSAGHWQIEAHPTLPEESPPTMPVSFLP
jgi:hypothetical protein